MVEPDHVGHARHPVFHHIAPPTGTPVAALAHHVAEARVINLP